MAQVYDFTDAYVAKMPGVKAAVADEGKAIAARARSALATHRETGAARITVSRGVTDYVVSLVDNDKKGSAVAIEFGGIRRKGRDEPQVIEGLFILTKAARL